MNKRMVYILASLLLAIAAAVIVPMTVPSTKTPASIGDGGAFLKSVGIGLRNYADAHEGEIPHALSALYPDYVTDRRVTDPILQFGRRRAVLIYWRPEELVDANEAVAQLAFHPENRTIYQWYLWGDGNVRLQRQQLR